MKKVSKPMIFLFIILFFYLALSFFDVNYVKFAFNNFYNSLFRILPIIFIVFFIMFLVNLFLKPELIKKHFGKKSSKKAWFYILVAGVLVPFGPPYVLFPLLGDLKKHGMRNAFIISFLYIRNLQFTFLIAMIFYFGLKFTLIFVFYIVIFSFLGGIVLEKFLDRN